jgi:hypothetical protein
MDALWAANFITQTPPSLTYQNGDVRGLYTTMQRIANAALTVIATVGALNSILRPHLGFRYHSLSAFVPRLVVGAILINTALWWVQFAIDVNNAMAASIGDATPPNWNTLNGAHQALTDIVLGLLCVIAGLLLVIQMLMRLAWIDVLLVAARMLGSSTDARLGAELESALHRGSLHAVRSGDRVETRRHAAGRGRQTGTGCDLAVVPDGSGHTVADISDSQPHAGRCWWECG